LKSPRRRLRRFLKSKGGIDTIIAELLMVVIVVIMSVITFAFYQGVFGALLGATSLHPENFEIVAAGSPSSGGFNVSAVHPTPGSRSLNTGGTTCTGTITPVNVNYYVPPGASCTINGGTFQSINVNYGASLTINGGNLQAINDNYSASINVINNAHVAGGMNLYGTGSFSMTNSNAASGAVVMDGVLYATYSNNILGATTNVKNSGSVQYDSNTMSGTVVYTNDQVVRFTNNTVNGTLTFSADPNCYQANNTVSGTITGICAGGAPSGGLDIMNTGSSAISFNTLYLDSQPWNGISWQLETGTTEQCGNNAIPIGPCTVWPIVVPSNTMVHITFSWVNPTPTSPVTILMWTTFGNYLEARVDPNAGLVCSTRSIYAPRQAPGFC
jgi:hypothetical protein